ncbi:MAG: FkbM family methyltransferase [Bacteroidota bacterium]|nr:FkbM family methyltransferase [Bacteroidota bacterium]
MKAIYFIYNLFRYTKRFSIEGLVLLMKQHTSNKEFIIFQTKEFKQPINLRNKSSDINTFNQVIFDKEYEIALNFEPKVIIDCGANIGLATVYFKNRYPKSKVIALEVEKSNFEILLQNIKGYDDVTSYNKGIWNKTTKLKIENINSANWSFMVSEAPENYEGGIDAISLDEIMRVNNLNSIDILKIDIEGSEKELFEKNYEGWLSKTKVLIIELHDKKREGCSVSLVKALSKYNFELFHKGENMVIIFKQDF